MTTVRLTKDKTRIHPKLKIGTEGIIKGTHRACDSIAFVYFSNINKQYRLFDNCFEIILSENELKNGEACII